jgi:hypothetical protein
VKHDVVIALADPEGSGLFNKVLISFGDLLSRKLMGRIGEAWCIV